MIKIPFRAFGLVAVELGNEALGAFVRVAAWAEENRSRGRAPKEILDAIALPETWDIIVAEGLMRRDVDSLIINSPADYLIQGSPRKNYRKRASTEGPIPEGWKPTAKHVALAATLKLDANREAVTFRDHAQAHGRTLVDWNAGFTMWLKKASQWRGVDKQQPAEYCLPEFDFGK